MLSCRRRPPALFKDAPDLTTVISKEATENTGVIQKETSFHFRQLI
jgi:hypothetical protein